MDETKRIEGPELVHPKKFAPRPTYEHRAIFDRADDDLDDELRIGALPVDRLFDLREAFEGFVDQGSYTGVHRCEFAPRPFRTTFAIDREKVAVACLFYRFEQSHIPYASLSPPRCAYISSHACRSRLVISRQQRPQQRLGRYAGTGRLAGETGMRRNSILSRKRFARRVFSPSAAFDTIARKIISDHRRATLSPPGRKIPPRQRLKFERDFSECLAPSIGSARKQFRQFRVRREFDAIFRSGDSCRLIRAADIRKIFDDQRVPSTISSRELIFCGCRNAGIRIDDVPAAPTFSSPCSVTFARLQ